ncbi:MAG: 50S ribosomal protein L10 [Candidatus Freyarchaeota archaeon]|nr:50S ribosomal protein L10 [Candidatus Freyrarchaeum guaymaensis]
MQVELTARGRPVPEYKLKKVAELVRLMEKHDVIGIAGIEGIGAKQLQELRSKLRGQALIRVEKNTLVKKAIGKLAGKKKGIGKLEAYIRGPIALIFTNMNPVKLNMFLEKNKTRAPVKPETITPVDIVVPAGNTGLPPGPVISELGNVGLPTRVESGTIWITKDTVVAKAGDLVSKPLADVLRRLGIEPLEVGLTLKAAYDSGVVLSEDELKVNVEEVFASLKAAHVEAFNLAVNAQIMTPETAMVILRIAHVEAFNLAVNAAVATAETLPAILRVAEGKAVSLALRIMERKPEAAPEEVFALTKRETPPPSKEEKPEKEKEEEEEEEEEVGGLGSLFA